MDAGEITRKYIHALLRHLQYFETNDNYVRKKNDIKNYYGLIVSWSHVALRKNFSTGIVIFYSFSTENIGNLNIFRQILIFFAQFQMKNYYKFAKISQGDDMISGNYDFIVFFYIIFSPCTFFSDSSNKNVLFSFFLEY